MARGIDIGGYVEQLTRRATGGRRTPSDRSERSVRDRLRETGEKVRRTTDDAARRRRRKRRERALPPEGVVAIEYSPRMDGDPDPGEIVWTWVPFEEDPSKGKDRPVVVIGRRGQNLTGVPLTTRRDDREAQVSIGTGGWDAERRESFARIWRMLDIDADRMRREGAVLGRDRFDRVVAAVDQYYDVRLPADDGFAYD